MQERDSMLVYQMCNRNGWGEPPTVNECPNCARYIKDIKALKEQLARYKALERAREY